MKTKVQKSKNKIPNTKNKGITLVALVITIIVLLILAGVAINMAINSDGLFRKANEAVEQYEQARKNESYAISDLQDIFTELETGIEIEEVIDTVAGKLEGSGTEADPYTINSIEDLVFFSQDVRNGNTYAEKYVKLGLSLDFNSTKSYVDALRTDYAQYGYDGELKTLLTTGEGFRPIGQNDFTEGSDNTKLFAGTFDGNGKVIVNLYINMKDTNQMKVGLFSRNNGNIKNLGLANVNIKTEGKITNLQIGSIAGQHATGTIEKCYATGNITASALNIGGIVASCAGNVNNCYSGVNIVNDVREGASGTTIKMGGIVAATSSGSLTLTLTNCYNTGKIQNTSTVAAIEIGGIAGRIQEETSNCYNTGDIIVNTQNTTDVRIGGIGGSILERTSNCYNDGKVSLDVRNSTDIIGAGGIGGCIQQQLENCHSKGKMEIISEDVEVLRIGAIAGINYNTKATNCTYLSSITENGFGRKEGEEVDTITAVTNKSDMPSILSVVGETGAYKENPENTEYPILNWQ